MNLFDVLSNGERIIVALDATESLIITWNQSLTLQAWFEYEGEYTEYGIRMLSNEPKDYKAARQASYVWLAEGIEDDR